MKKFIATLLIAAGACLYASAQGLVEVYNIGTANANYTNSLLSVYNNPPGTSGASVLGVAANVANGWYYALLTATYGGAVPSSDPTSSAWSLALMATNYLVNGGMRAAGGAAGTAVPGWAGGQTDYIMLVGWSASLGATWSQVENEIATRTYIANGFLGVSPVGYITAASSPSPATSIFGGNGLASGLTMDGITTTVVPEPGTLALAVLGGASLLLLAASKHSADGFRRKK